MHLLHDNNNINDVEPFEKHKNAKEPLNLKQKRLRIASVKSQPYQDVERINESYSIGKGFSFEIVDHLSQHFNFTYDVVIPSDQDFGMLMNGSYWTGLMGMLLNESADMAAAPISITQERQKVVTFGTVLFEDSLGLLFSREQGRQNSAALVAPFSNTVWIVVIAVAAMVCPILYLLVRLSNCVQRRRKRRLRDSKTYLSVSDCIWFVYSGLMKQGFEKSTTSVPVRLLMIAWWLTCILITAFYTANLTAFLTTENSAVEQNIRDLTQSRSRWTFKKGTAFSHTLLQTNDFEDKEEFSLLRDSVAQGYGTTVNTEDEAIQLAQQGYAYIQEVNVLNYLLFQDFLKSNGYCQFHVLDLQLFKHSSAFAFPRGSPYASHFSEHMDVLRKNGMVQKWMQEYLLNADVCSIHHDYKLSQKEQALSLNEVYTAFYLLLIGLFAGSLIFIVEIRGRSCRKYWRSKIRYLKKKWR